MKRSLSPTVFIASLLLLHAPRASADNVPVTPVPPGYGNYCSLTYKNGGWAFGSHGSVDTDPCGEMLKKSPGGTIARAGLWAVQGDNNVMVRCQGDLRIYRGTGGQILDKAFAEAKGKRGCIFIVAPTTLPVFGLPYGKTAPDQNDPSDDVSKSPSGFNYDVYGPFGSCGPDWDVTQFGEPRDSKKPSHQVDRYGNQNWNGTKAECAAQALQSGCTLRIGSNADCSAKGKPNSCTLPGRAFEPAYDWTMPSGKPIVAVADGIVRGAVLRDISSYHCSYTNKLQHEIFVEHQIGTGIYAEHFISAYHHMSKNRVKTGDTVARGDTIGDNGTTGCSGGPHLDFQVFRLTNLTGARSYEFKTTKLGWGVNGAHSIIDPFGWVAPMQVDPWAWKCIGYKDPFSIPPEITDPGAFSINLWSSGQVPPTY